MSIHNWISISILVAALGGCASRMPSLVDLGDVSVEVVKPEKVRISRVDVDQEGEGMRVSGEIVRRGDILPVTYVGHIDVTVIAPNSMVLAKVGTAYFPRRVPRKRGGHSNFKISIPVDPLPGTIVRIEHHRTLKIDPDEHGV
jgi:hypothetical protein